MIYSFEYLSDAASTNDWQRKIEVTIKVDVEKVYWDSDQKPRYSVDDWKVLSIHAENGEDLMHLYKKGFDLFKEITLQIDDRNQDIIDTYCVPAS
jgi:hypothetical protein